jgi:alginate O-acetyltransferase complex protein AlgI
MLFNSLNFAVFLLIIFLLYWLLANRSLKYQNLFLLGSSYFFYAMWDWRFLFLLFFISFANYSIGLLIQRTGTKGRKKSWLIAGIAANILILSYFKYFDFFIDGFIHLFSTIGFILQKPTLNIILPLGISFYIFLSLSYIIDIYRNKLEADKNLVDVLLTLSFFPIILAGPIQRPVSLLPQIREKRVFKYDVAIDGLRQILWGLFMKVVIADNCADYVNNIFHDYYNYDGSTLLLGGFFYSVQIYADFAGYSEIAIGVSKLFGFELMRNFAFPYFAKDITEFWRRWHISLTSWFRDYLFLPLAYFVSRKIPSEKVLFLKTDLIIYITSISITWLLTGLWHGANYTFIVWGFMHGFLLIAYHVLKKPRQRFLRSLKVKNNSLFLIGFERTFTLMIIIVTWVVFRSENIMSALNYISIMFSSTLLVMPELPEMTTIFLVVFFFIIEWFGRNKLYAISHFGRGWKRAIRWSFYYGLIITIFYFAGKQQDFIYFQF